MYTRLFVYPYSLSSQSARDLAINISAKRVREHGNYRYRDGHLVINWGNPRMPYWATQNAVTNMLNKPQYVNIASNKYLTLNTLALVDFTKKPDWTTLPEMAKEWLTSPKYPGFKNAVVCRTLLRANSGRGIVLATTSDEVIPAPLYTRYVPKVKEFRIHVLGGQVRDMQQKKKPNNDTSEVNSYIRNHANGWVFCREDINVPDSCQLAALEVVALLVLDFLAVDLGWHPECGVCVYEVNTAPGLVGQTLETYVGYFRHCIG